MTTHSLVHDLPYAVALWLFVAGCFGLVRSRNLIHAILCLNVAQSSTYVLLMAIDFHVGTGPPVFSSSRPPGSPSVDPILHALALTDIVVGATTTALLLALTAQIYRRTGSLDPQRLRSLAE